MKKIISKALSYAGYEIKKKETDIFLAPRDTFGYIVELIGASGAGKTTLFSNIKADLGSEWCCDYPTRYSSPLKDNVSNADFDEVFCALMLNKTKNVLGKPYSFRRKLQLLSFYQGRCQQELDVRERGLVDITGFFLHDGLFQTFSREVCEVAESGAARGALEDFARNRVIIYLECTTETLKRNLTDRSLRAPDALNNHVKNWGAGFDSHLKNEVLTKKKLVATHRKLGGLSYHVRITGDLETDSARLLSTAKEVAEHCGQSNKNY